MNKRRLVPSYITLSLLSTILGFYLIGERLGNGELIVERTEFIVEYNVLSHYIVQYLGSINIGTTATHPLQKLLMLVSPRLDRQRLMDFYQQI